MHQNTQLSQENKELKKENKDLVKKHNEMVARVNAFKPTEKKLAACEAYARARDGDIMACKHDFHRMRKMKEGLEKELNDAKTAGADKTLAKTLKNLEDKVFSQVGLGACFIHLFL
jgi:predicted RNase H-like nuclease (RuvC/YqgF family)